MDSTSERRDWNWDSDGALQGLYIETRSVRVKTGPSAGREKLVFDFHQGLDDELVSVWETAVLRSKFREELANRGKSDFEPGEAVSITPLGKKVGPNGAYRNFDVEFENAAPRRTTAELLGVDTDEDAGDERPIFESDAA